MGNNIQKEEPIQKQHANDDTALSSTKQSSASESSLVQSKYKRKGSDANHISQEATEQYFNNLGHSQLHPKPQPPSLNDQPTVSQSPSKAETVDQKQMKKVIMSSQLNSNSVMNDTIMNTNLLGSNPHQSTSTSSSNSTDGVSNTHLQNNPSNNIQSDSLKESFPDEEGYSQQVKKSSFLSNPINSYTSDKSDIDIDIKNIFKDQQRTKSILGSRPNSEIDLTDRFTNSNETTSYIATLYQNDYELNFYRNGEEIRHSYIAKLITKKVWTPSQKEKTHNSLIIFDWDDTLLCTSFLTPKGVYDENLILTEKDKEKIAKLEFSVLRLLTIAVEKGDVYIITNAGVGWVEFSAEKYYPSIMPLLQKIRIISARGAYEAKFPNDSRRWKVEAFLDMQKKFNSELVTNILCLGDSFIEIEAGHLLAAKFTQAFIKTVKFRESPKPDELNKQLTLVADQFVGIYSAIKNLTIRVEKKKK